jgi:hypothetical protein
MEAGRTDTMKPDKQRLAIAEYCGTDLYINDELSDRVPDYLNDLNAMNEAEKSLSSKVKVRGGGSDQLRYALILESVLCPTDRYGDSGRASYFQLINATAAQKAKAFLKTIGKWEE